MKQYTKRALSLAAALSLMLGLLSACAPKAEAATMHLKRTEGTVGVSDGEGKGLEPVENLGLFSGYGVDTKEASYAWIDLDEVKLTKMDENSQVEIIKEDRHLTIEVKSGSLFFNITEPLADDETLDIRTSTMVVGIRGTCGWVTQDSAALLEGTVTVTAGERSVTINAGEKAVLTAEGTLEVEPLTAESVPAFVREEIEKDEKLAEAIPDPAETDLPEADPLEPYAKALARLDEIVYTGFVDFAQDGSPELLVIGRQTNEEIRPSDTQPKIQTVVYSAVSEENSTSRLMNDLTYYFKSNYEGFHEEWHWSLVELDGRLFIKKHHIGAEDLPPYEFESAYYMGFNDEGEWSEESVTYMVNTRGAISYSYLSYTFGHYDERITRDIDAGEFAAVQAKYREVQVIAHRLNDGPVVADEP